MTKLSSLRLRLVGTVFLAVTPVAILSWYANGHWEVFLIGLTALIGASIGARVVVRKIRALSSTAAQLAAGDLSARTSMLQETSELGELARNFDTMAASLQLRLKDREHVEKALMTRALQQTVVSALGQFTLLNKDFPALLQQASILVAQTLEVEYSEVLELQPDGKALVLRAGVGWRDEAVGSERVPAAPRSQGGFTLAAGAPVVFENLGDERRFFGSPLLLKHGVVSGMSVAISGQGRAFGILGAHTTHHRKFSEDEVHFLLAVATLLGMSAARKAAEAQLEKVAAFAQLNPNPAMEIAPSGRITYYNDAALHLVNSVGQTNPAAILPANIGQIVASCLATGQSLLSHQTLVEGRTLSWSFHPVPASRVIHAYVDDITERLNLEAQLRQSQKMESIGQLAAGVAHDFNNMLTIIQGHAGLLMARSEVSGETLQGVQSVYFAAERAASLTRQLLMFSRKSFMQPALLDLREIVSNTSRMLKRLLGETITLQFNPPAEIPLIKADAGMIEQVVMNLAVNGRDAMPGGGTLTISTLQTEIDATYALAHPDARTGRFICLQVADSGCGMDASTIARIFEPFFTTKEVGKGTGLGLATVYGIVKQHDGWIEVASEVGKGTTFSIYFPAQGEPVRVKTQESAPTTALRGGKETVLVVEDEEVLREMAQAILEDCGYTVLQASSGAQALKLWETHRDAIHLVVTDMVMPEGVSGMELAAKLYASKPSLRIVLASGYSMDDLHNDFVTQSGAVFLQKPYTHITLTKAVRECLDKA
jgi:signal transduction histidine kinase/CheY-like chemotaxis protein/HAMP domain-containing protein